MRFCFFSTEISLTAERFSALCKRVRAEFFLVYNPSIFNDYLVKIPFLSKFFGCDDENYIEKLIKKKPDLVGMTLYSDVQLHRKLDILKKIKERLPDVKIIVGGPHVTISGEDILKRFSFIDFAVRGAGEGALEGILKEKDLSELPGLIYRTREKIVCNNWKFSPNEELYNIPQKNTLYSRKFPYLKKSFVIDSNYGCLFSCSFCYHSIFDKKSIVFRDPKRLVDDILTAQKNGAKMVFFFDDNFIILKQKTLELLNIYRKKISIPFICIVHPTLLDEELINAMKEAGCIGIEMGVQTMNEELRKKYLKRFEKDKDIINTMKLAQKYNIPLKIDHLFGIPDQTEEDHIRAFLIYKKFNISHVSTFFLMLYPKLEINKILLEKGMIDNNTLVDIEKGNISNFHKHPAVEVDPNILKLEAMAALIPIFPYNFIKLILKKRLYRMMPNSLPFWFFRFLIYFLEAIFSKQHVMSRREMYIYYKTMKDSIVSKIKEFLKGGIV